MPVGNLLLQNPDLPAVFCNLFWPYALTMAKFRPISPEQLQELQVIQLKSLGDAVAFLQSGTEGLCCPKVPADFKAVAQLPVLTTSR